MKFGDLHQQIAQDIFPNGESENLVLPHRRALIQGIVDLQQCVPCLRYANTDVYPQCATYFNCGMTVLQKPNGAIRRLYTIGKKDLLGTQVGTQIGDVSIDFGILQLVDNNLVANPQSGSVCQVTEAGLYTVNVSQTNNKSALYPANSPQYIVTQISYTDASGNPQTIQPAGLMHLSDNAKNGTVVIDCGADSEITYTITPVNVPQVDGIITVEINVTAGSSDASNDDWCSKVFYDQVEFRYIDTYMRACRGCNASNQIWNVANAIAANLFGNWRDKRLYSPPTDIGFENLPPLPQGFHYPQKSTDAGGRSKRGVFAVKHGKIYVVPWIESTETLVIEWNGVKTNWSDDDLISDNPLFYKAMKLLFAIDHFTNYEDNIQRLNLLKEQYFGLPGQVGALRALINECRENSRQRSESEVGSSNFDSAEGVGITTGTSSNTGIYYNKLQSYTAQCPAGQVGQPVTIQIQAGLYTSSLSQSDADAQALAAAQTQAQSQLNCVAGGTFQNTAQTFVAKCPASSGSTPAAQGSQVSITIPAGQYTSTVSQDLANAAAQRAAQAKAMAQLNCTYYNAPQTSNVKCADNTTRSATIPAGQYTSTVSQADADQQALSAAQSQATTLCAGAGSGLVVGNTTQVVPYNIAVISSCRSLILNGSITIPANTFISPATAANVSQVVSDLNLQAQQLAQAKINTIRNTETWKLESICSFELGFP